MSLGLDVLSRRSVYCTILAQYVYRLSAGISMCHGLLVLVSSWCLLCVGDDDSVVPVFILLAVPFVASFLGHNGAVLAVGADFLS